MMGDKQNAKQVVSPTQTIASWVADLPADRTRRVEKLATDGIRDLLGCMIGGSRERTASKAAVIARKWGLGAATIVGHTGKASAPWAAFANGTASHVLDFDDSFEPMTGHPSAPLVPALFALAEEQGLSGSKVLDAYVVGLEVIASIGRAVNPSHYMSGWHSTATIGVIGAAAACARLLDLDAKGVSDAISIAVSRSSGSRLQLGFPMKSVHAGFAAQDAVIAAVLAAAGIGGNPEPLIGKRSFTDLYSGASGDSASFTMPAPDQLLAIERPGLTFKPYPTCGSTHRSLDALLDLRGEHGFSSEDIESVELIIPALNVNNLVYDQPATGMQARFSMPYCAALAIDKGALELQDFEDDTVAQSLLGPLMARITMLSLAGSETTDKDYLELPARTVVRLRSGRVLEDSRYLRGGSVGAPMSENAHRAKFLDCAHGTLSPFQCDHLLAVIASLPLLENIEPLMMTLRPAAE
ncbi:MmgE/PrpD family protein [Agrobacterium vitis]|uniref:MmgE/PrpD family protein n=1 Tax=Agrobacterium vitis TaxID=373 RepID=UPI0012E73191|nr:MmgE/PrpD family protein [Agrobacterium vitis]MUZ65375.1 MmgE/PrpD family protein [Agrobacterium vitis]